MRPNYIINFWGPKNLKCWPASSLHDVDIPQPSKQFLIEVGLPNKEDWTLRFDHESDDLPRLPNKGNFRCIGFDDFVPLCFDENRLGCVIADETEIGGSERFVNSNVEYFAEFLVLYQEYRITAQVLSEEEIGGTIDKTEAMMCQADPKAFDNPNNYWSVIVEQMRQGML